MIFTCVAGLCRLVLLELSAAAWALWSPCWHQHLQGDALHLVTSPSSTMLLKGVLKCLTESCGETGHLLGVGKGLWYHLCSCSFSFLPATCHRSQPRLTICSLHGEGGWQTENGGERGWCLSLDTECCSKYLRLQQVPPEESIQSCGVTWQETGSLLGKCPLI